MRSDHAARSTDYFILCRDIRTVTLEIIGLTPGSAEWEDARVLLFFLKKLKIQMEYDLDGRTAPATIERRY